MESLKSLQYALAQSAYGRTPGEARSKGICVCCGKKLDFDKLLVIDRAEYRISALGPCCFPKEE